MWPFTKPRAVCFEFFAAYSVTSWQDVLASINSLPHAQTTTIPRVSALTVDVLHNENEADLTSPSQPTIAHHTVLG